MFSKIQRRNKIKARIRGRISGTAERPRMTVFRSNKQIYVQLVDDLKGTTLVAASSKGIEEGDKTAIPPRSAKPSPRKLSRPASQPSSSTATAISSTDA